MDADDIDIKKIRRENSGKRKKIASENGPHNTASHYTDSPVIISAKDLTKSFRMGRTNLRVLKGVDVQVHRGQFMAITGSSGSGKSTLLHLLGGLDRPDTGMVEFNGGNIADYSAGKLNRYRNKSVGFVFQFYHLIDELTVLENILLPVMASVGTISWLTKSFKAKKAAMDLLELVGLADRAKQKSYQLSGGERQRVAIARALINKPDVILADEPTGNLDSKTGNGILNLFEDLNRAGQTIIMVTHDELIAHRTHNVVKLVDGKIE